MCKGPLFLFGGVMVDKDDRAAKIATVVVPILLLIIIAFSIYAGLTWLS